jgi:peptidoglycan/xylan/chitin deacetylase (PgdA/CDA1 family)
MKIIQCWDDGVTDDIRLIEILRRHGARATFNLNFGRHERERKSGGRITKLALGELVEVYQDFQVANHTLTHPWLTRIAASEAVEEIRKGKDSLEQLFGREVPGFAYPFGDFNAEIMQLVSEVGHTYARTTVKRSPSFPPEDAMAFHPDCHFLAENFWSLFEEAKAADRVFYFWGHSYEMATEEDWSRFEEKIARLSNDLAVEWEDIAHLVSSHSSARGEF